MSEIYSFALQKNGYCCAEHSIMNALMVLGVPITSEDAHAILESSLTVGPNIVDINRHLEKYGCAAQEYCCKDEQQLKELIDGFLEKHVPLVICTDLFQHYSLLAGQANEKYIWIDSSGPAIVGASTWVQLEEWLNSGQKDERYYFIAIQSNNMDNVTIIDIAGLRRLYLEDVSIINSWGRYLSDLLDIFGTVVTSDKKIAAVDFLETHGMKVIATICELYSYEDTGKLQQMLRAYKIIASMHRLILKHYEDKALIRMTVKFAMFVLSAA